MVNMKAELMQSLQLKLVLEPVYHAHIKFGHCYKQQEGWTKYLSRFVHGGGILYDIEFLTGLDGRRVAAFGYYAGYAGAAVALMAWARIRCLTPVYLSAPSPRHHPH